MNDFCSTYKHFEGHQAGNAWRRAKNDAFQHYIYTHPKLTINEISEYWLHLDTDVFNVGIDRTGFENDVKTAWHHVGHFFFAPFYMLDYAIAGLGAMQVYHNYLKDRESWSHIIWSIVFVKHELVLFS